VRRRVLALGLLGIAVLGTASVAAATNGGFSPEQAHSPNAHKINQAYLLVFVFTTAIFLIVETVLAVFIWRFRSRGRPRTVDGAQIHGHASS
jgi:heme/copper-type cytochrome/quinol oxidase subunit 2